MAKKPKKKGPPGAVITVNKKALHDYHIEDRLEAGIVLEGWEVKAHIQPDPQRTRKLLLHKDEINRLIGAIERKGYTVVALSLYWKNGKAKVEIGLAKGKKLHDKRAAERERDWAREKQRLLKSR